MQKQDLLQFPGPVSFWLDSYLHAGRCAEFAPLYGGSYEQARDHNPDLPWEDYARLWEAVCTRRRLRLLVAHIAGRGTPGVAVPVHG